MAHKLLLIDDEPMILKMMQSRFQAHHYEVLVASSGEEGIKLAKKSKPNLIVLDILMPGMDGHETCKRLKADPDTKDIPIVMFSCNLKLGMQTECIEEGAVGVIYKPEVKKLLESVKAVLAGVKFKDGFEDSLEE